MEEDTLISIALVCVLVGLPLLYLVSSSLDPGEYNAIEHKVIGKVTRIIPGDYTKLYVEETRMVPVIIQGSVSVTPGTVIEATGSPQHDAFFAEEIKVHQPE